jgi:proteic killer suppression protein
MLAVSVFLSGRRVVVDILFRTSRLKRDCEDVGLARTRWGPDLARVIMRRLVQVQAAQCLEDLPSMPPTRRHKLTGNRKEQYALDLTNGRRLILQPILPNGEPDLTSDPSRITRVRIVEVTDYHD